MLQVKPEEEDDVKETQLYILPVVWGKLHFTKHLFVTIGHLDMERQDFLLKHLSDISAVTAFITKKRCSVSYSGLHLHWLCPPLLYPCLQAQPAAWIQIRTLVVLMIKRERNYKGLVMLSNIRKKDCLEHV